MHKHKVDNNNFLNWKEIKRFFLLVHYLYKKVSMKTDCMNKTFLSNISCDASLY